MYSTCAPEFIDFSTEFEDIVKKSDIWRIGGTTNSKYFCGESKLISLPKAEIDVLCAKIEDVLGNWGYLGFILETFCQLYVLMKINEFFVKKLRYSIISKNRDKRRGLLEYLGSIHSISPLSSKNLELYFFIL